MPFNDTGGSSPIIRVYMPELDSLRGVAILLVLFFHGMAPVQNAELSSAGKIVFDISHYGWGGVNLFFVLSGFLITGILMDSRDREDYYRRFYIRRALRILPALYAMLVLLLVGGWIKWQFLLLSAVLLANSTPLLGVALQYGPLWSLAVEEHFYLLWPALIRRLSPRRLILVIAVIFTLSPLSREIGFVLAHYPQNFASLYTWSNLDGLALGASLAIWLRQPWFRREQLSRVALPLLLGGLAAFVVIAKYPSAEAAFGSTACNLTSAGLVSCTLLAGTTHWSFVVDRPFLKFLGFISYGLYLVHLLAYRLAEILFSRWLSQLISAGWPTAAMLLRFLAGSVLALVVAYVSRGSLEKKFLRMGFASKPIESSSTDRTDLGTDAAPHARLQSQSVSWVQFLFFCSGFPALIYQIVWQRALFAAYGLNIESVTIVVSAFMLGLGMGSLAGGALSRSTKLPMVWLFAGAEFLVSIFGFTSLRLFHYVAEWTIGSSLLKTGVVSFLLIVIPTVLMGATLPLLVEQLMRRSRNLGSTVGTLYFVNTLGSGLACFVAADVLMRRFGQSGSVRLAAAINLLVAMGAILYGMRPKHQASGYSTPVENSPAESDGPPVLSFPLAVLVAAFCGFAALSYEIVWYRLLAFATGGIARVFASLLGSYLLGLALGSRWMGRKCDGPLRNPDAAISALAWILFGSALVGFGVAPATAVVLKFVSPHGVNGASEFVYPLVFFFICSGALFFGASFPLIAHAIGVKNRAGAAVSYIYAANIAGSTAGSLLVGLILMDHISLFAISLLLLIAGIACSIIVLMASHPTRPATNAAFMFGLGLLVTLVARPIYGSIYDRLLFKSDYPKAHFARVVETRSGVIGVTPDGTVFGGGAYDGRFNVDLTKDINGISRPYAISALHPTPRRVLMIGLGSGSWAQVVANHPQVEALQIVEINPGYLELIPQYPAVRTVPHNPKVTIAIDDGRRWLLRHPEEKFDFVIANTTFYWRDHISNLLSVEFLQIVRKHLNQGGVFYYNTTRSDDAMATGMSVFPYALRFTRCIAVSDSPILFDRNRWKSVLLEYAIDGKPVVDEHDPQQMSRLDELVNMKDDPSGADDLSVEFDDQLRRRLHGRLIITDDNMGLEWR
jgi:spermidine synthase